MVDRELGRIGYGRGDTAAEKGEYLSWRLLDERRAFGREEQRPKVSDWEVLKNENGVISVSSSESGLVIDLVVHLGLSEHGREN